MIKRKSENERMEQSTFSIVKNIGKKPCKFNNETQIYYKLA